MASTNHNNIEERRNYVRIDCLMAARIVAIENIDKRTMKRSAALTKNVSASGLLFKDTREYEINQLVVIEIDAHALDELNNNIARVIKTRGYVLGKIVRIEQFEEENARDYGVCFVRVDDLGEDYFEIFQALLNKIGQEQ
ncbi:PilZ domain-containing protein [Candidatus Omnitrophota bacterium]